MTIRTYHDPLHHAIKIDSSRPEEDMVMQLIDTEPFQRLRRIRQLGPAYLTFHGAESSRFTHSIGVFHITRKAINNLVQIDPSLNQERGILYASSLLHDLGHGPLSHSGEGMFGINHEKWSSKIIKGHKQIKNILERFSNGTSTHVSKILELNSNEKSRIKSLISSQLDCDRLDYLLRDSYSTGTNYGKLDLERILSALTIAPDGDIAISPKGLMAVEHYLVVRNLMYRGVYNHRLNEVSNWILEKIISIARVKGSDNIWTDNVMKNWLWNQNRIDIDTFLANDDIRTYYHLLRWKEEGPKSLAILCEMFINRNLLKALNIKNFSNESKLEILAITRKICNKKLLDADLYCGIRNHKHHGYDPYKGGLRLWDGKQLSALESSSPLIKSLITPEKSSWLIYPREIHEDLKKEINFFKEKN